MESCTLKNSKYLGDNDTLHLMAVRLRIDYENCNKRHMKCQIHSSSAISSYCRKCKQKMCLKCESNHDQHETVDRNTIVLEKIDNISSLIDKFCSIKSDINEVISQCDRQRTTIYKDQKTSLDNIDIVFSDLHREIEKLKGELLLELQQVVESCLGRLDSNKVELLALQDDVSSITDLVVRENSAFEYYDLFELEEYTSQKLFHYTQTLPLDHLRPNELNIQVKWSGSVRNIIKQPLAKINCHLSPERLSYLQTITTSHPTDKIKSSISSVCCDRNNVIYLCDSANNSIKVLHSDYTIEKCFTGTGVYKLVTPTTVLSLSISGHGSLDKSSQRCATVIVADPGSQNVVTFDRQGQGIDQFVTNGNCSSMCSISDLNELENLQESSLELSPIYASLDNYESPDDVTVDTNAIVLCSHLENHHLEFLQINPRTLKLCKSRPDLNLSVIDSNNYQSPKSIAWNSLSKYLFILEPQQHKVLIFSSQDGRFIRFYGRFGTGPEELNEPSCIVVDNDGQVLISDTLNNRIHVLDSQGNFLKFLFPFSNKQPISKPTAMCFDNNNNFLVCEMDGKMKIYTY